VTSLDRSVTAVQRYTRVASVAGALRRPFGRLSVSPPLVCAFDQGSGGLPRLDRISGEVIDMHERQARTSGKSSGTWFLSAGGSFSAATAWALAQTAGAPSLGAVRGGERVRLAVGGFVGDSPEAKWLDARGSQTRRSSRRLTHVAAWDKGRPTWMSVKLL
jgi:hypothetical protein